MANRLAIDRLDRDYCRRWRAEFGFRSKRARRALNELVEAFGRRDNFAQNAFQTTRRIRRATGKELNPDRSMREAVAFFRETSPSLDGDLVGALSLENVDEIVDALDFILQTYAAQSILASLERFFDWTSDDEKNFFGITPFDWGETIRKDMRVERETLISLQFEERVRERDPFAETTRLLFPAHRRRALGEFYTPNDLAKRLAGRAISLSNAPLPTFLDPTCGAGVFLAASARELLSKGADPSDVLERVSGFDACPLAVLTARANLLVAIFANFDSARRRFALREAARRKCEKKPRTSVVNVTLWDALTESPPNLDAFFFGFDGTERALARIREKRFDVVAGNPPWIVWDGLSEEYRRETLPYWRDFGLFSLDARAARFGGAKKELAALIATAAVSRRLKTTGTFAFALPKSLFFNEKAGAGFRFFGENVGTPFAILEFDDYSELALFSGVASRAVGVVGKKGEKTQFPVPAQKWTARDFNGTPLKGLAFPRSKFQGSPWRFVWNRSISSPSNRPDATRQNALVEKLFEREERASRSTRYVAKLGANAAGASGVFWLEILESLDSSTVLVRNLFNSGKRKVEPIETRVETALLFPLLRWRDIESYRADVPKTFILIPQDANARKGLPLIVMERSYPLALEYLQRFESTLRERAAFRRYQNNAPFWSLYNIGKTTFAPRKVVWRRIDAVMRAALVKTDKREKKPIVPQETLSFVPVDSDDEGDYLCAVLNSDVAREFFDNAGCPGAKSFGSPGAFAAAPIPKFAPNDEFCQKLAKYGKAARIAAFADYSD